MNYGGCQQSFAGCSWKGQGGAAAGLPGGARAHPDARCHPQWLQGQPRLHECKIVLAARPARRTITEELNRDRMTPKKLSKKEVGSQLKSGDAEWLTR